MNFLRNRLLPITGHCVSRAIGNGTARSTGGKQVLTIRMHGTVNGDPLKQAEHFEEGKRKPERQSTNPTRPTSDAEAKNNLAISARKTMLYSMVMRSPRIRDRRAIEELMANMLSEFPPGLYLFNVLLRARVLLNDAEGIKGILGLIKQSGLEPNLMTYNLLISYYRNNKRIEEAERLYRTMTKAGIQPDRTTLTTLVAGFAKADLKKAEEYFAQLVNHQEDRMRADLYAYNTMIGAYIRFGKLAEAKALCDNLDKVGIRPNYVTFKIFVNGLVLSGHHHEAYQLYEERLKESPKMQQLDHREILLLFLRAGKEDLALEIFDMMCQKYQKPDPRVLENLTSHYLESNKLKQAQHLFLTYILAEEDVCRELLHKYMWMFLQLGDRETVAKAVARCHELGIGISDRLSELLSGSNAETGENSAGKDEKDESNTPTETWTDQKIEQDCKSQSPNEPRIHYQSMEQGKKQDK